MQCCTIKAPHKEAKEHDEELNGVHLAPNADRSTQDLLNGSTSALAGPNETSSQSRRDRDDDLRFEYRCLMTTFDLQIADNYSLLFKSAVRSSMLSPYSAKLLFLMSKQFNRPETRKQTHCFLKMYCSFKITPKVKSHIREDKFIAAVS